MQSLDLYLFEKGFLAAVFSFEPDLLLLLLLHFFVGHMTTHRTRLVTPCLIKAISMPFISPHTKEQK